MVPTPTFQKVGPRDSHKNVTNLVGGDQADRADLSRSGLSEILEKQAENGFFKNWSQGFGFYEMLEHCWKRHFKMHIFKNFPGVLPPDPIISISLVISA